MAAMKKRRLVGDCVSWCVARAGPAGRRTGPTRRRTGARPQEAAADTASGAPTAPTSRARATRRSIRSTRTTSTTLEVAWRFKTDNLGPRPEFNFQSTPLMVGGWLYTTAGTRRAVVALDAATGEMKWMHSDDEGKRGEEAPRQLSGRGLAYWSDGRSARIIYVTPGYRMMALDARTGAPITSFGKNGIVDLKLEDDQEMDLDHRRHRTARRAGHRQGRRHHRRGAYRGQPAGEPPQREGLRARLRRAHGQAAVDLPHDPRARRVRQRHVGAGLRVVHRQHRRLGADERRRGARHGLPARRDADRRLLRRSSSRRRTCSARASSPSISRPASASGTTSSFSTASGTGICRARRSSPTSRSTAACARSWRSRPSRAGSTSSIA